MGDFGGIAQRGAPDRATLATSQPADRSLAGGRPRPRLATPGSRAAEGSPSRGPALAGEVSGWGVRIGNFGAAASTLCALHCAITPLLVGGLSIASFASETAEGTLLLAGTSIAATSLGFGWRQHGRRRPLALLAVGALLLASGWALAGSGSAAPSVAALAAGGLSVAAAQLWNGRLCRVCRACSATRAMPDGHDGFEGAL